MNKVILMGNLGADPELRMGSGTQIMKLRLATRETFPGKDGQRQERTDWHQVVMFGPRAEALAKHLSKGQGLLIEGSLRTRSYEKDGEKRYSTEVIANNIEWTGGARDGAYKSNDGGNGSGGSQVTEAPRKSKTDAMYNEELIDDDIPF